MVTAKYISFEMNHVNHVCRDVLGSHMIEIQNDD